MNKLLLKDCRYIVTQNKNHEILEHKDILVVDNRISKIGRISTSAKTIDCRNMVVLPGLVNLHTHACTNLLRGISDDLQLGDWLKKRVWPAEAKIDDVYYGALLTAIESVWCGTTCIVDMGYQTDRVARAFETVGLRGFLGYCMIDRFNKQAAMEELKVGEANIEALTNSGFAHKPAPVAIPTVSVHAPNTCSEFLLRESARLARKHNLLNQVHILETEAEARVIRKRTGKGVIEYLDSLRFLSERTLGVHLCWLTDKEIKVYAKRGAAAVHCSTSNMKLASGSRTPVPELIKLGVRVGLGTDSNASNNNQDMFEEMKQTALLHKFALNDPRVMPAQTILDMATRTAGSILGLKLGVIAEEYLADMIAIDTRNPKLSPLSGKNLVSSLVYAVSGSDVTHTIINGKVVMENRSLKTCAMTKALADIQNYSESKHLFNQ